jgi:hypothetical protein
LLTPAARELLLAFPATDEELIRYYTFNETESLILKPIFLRSTQWTPTIASTTAQKNNLKGLSVRFFPFREVTPKCIIRLSKKSMHAWVRVSRYRSRVTNIRRR